MNIQFAFAFTLLAASGVLLISRTPLSASEMDDRIESSARKSYVFKTYLVDDSISTESKDGFVTLTGTVGFAAHKALAQDTVEGLPGVKGVDNRLTVKGETPAEHSDTWIAMKLKSVLLFHSNVSATKTHVDVQDGVVRLTGEASSLAQKDLVTEYAQDIDHVKSVRNDMTVATAEVGAAAIPVEGIDDASITAQVKAALLYHRSTSALKTQVATREGVVTVSGVARSGAEKSLVTKLIRDIRGVTKVVNNMTVSGLAADTQ